MPKFELGDALAAALKNVPDKVNSAAGGREGPLAGTSPSGAASPAGGENSQKHEQIEYIDLTAIDSDGNNFYSLDGIDALAANIELVGLQQPLRVRRNPDFAGRYILVSGHRRRAALGVLAGEGQERFQKVPCIVEEPEGSAALQELKLIYANSDTRKMSDADLSKQAERVEALLYQLKEEGYDFPGRMRDYVAEACKVSKTKLANLKVIRENAIPEIREIWGMGFLNEAKALSFAHAEPEVQRTVYERFGARALKTMTANDVDGALVAAMGRAASSREGTRGEAVGVRSSSREGTRAGTATEIAANAEPAVYGYVTPSHAAYHEETNVSESDTFHQATEIEDETLERNPIMIELRWIPGSEPPEEDCDAVCVFGFEDGAKLMQLASWRFERWNFYLMGGVGASIDAECLRWFPLPGVDADLM